MDCSGLPACVELGLCTWHADAWMGDKMLTLGPRQASHRYRMRCGMRSDRGGKLGVCEPARTVIRVIVRSRMELSPTT